MAEQEQRPRRTPPLEIVVEILLRLPPREPACLLRASLVCKLWGRAVSHPSFRRRLRERHGAPPVLGFFHNWEDQQIPRFIPTTAKPFSLAAPHCRFWRALDCRHGRALFLSKGQAANQRLLLWDPITGSRQRVRLPAAFRSSEHGAEKMSPTAAVFCAADGCDHSGCYGGPFRLVFVFSVKVDTDDEEYFTLACAYSSEASAWGAPTLLRGEFSVNFTRYSSVLVGKSLLYFMSDNLLIVEYDLARHNLILLDPPEGSGYVGRHNILLGEDGGLRFCQYLYPKLKMWAREASEDTDAQWVLSGAIFLEGLLPIGSLLNADSKVQVLGFAEGTNVIFLNTSAGIFTLDLQSRQASNVYDNCGFSNLIPVVSFYTPAPRGEHGDSSSSGPSEEAGGEEEGEEVQTVDQAQQLFDKGSDAIKEAGLVNERDIKIRDPCYGEVALECPSMEDKHGHVFPLEAQEMTDPLGDVPSSALSEELVKSTSIGSVDDARNSKTSGSNVEDAAPTS